MSPNDLSHRPFGVGGKNNAKNSILVRTDNVRAEDSNELWNCFVGMVSNWMRILHTSTGGLGSPKGGKPVHSAQRKRMNFSWMAKCDTGRSISLIEQSSQFNNMWKGGRVTFVNEYDSTEEFIKWTTNIRFNMCGKVARQKFLERCLRTVLNTVSSAQVVLWFRDIVN